MLYDFYKKPSMIGLKFPLLFVTNHNVYQVKQLYIISFLRLDESNFNCLSQILMFIKQSSYK